MKINNYPSLFLRIGLASVFIYIAIASFLQPLTWLAFFPEFMRNLSFSTTLLHIYSITEIILGIWLLSNKKIFYAALFSSLLLVGIVISTIKFLDIAFRDFAILTMALALLAIHWNNR